MQNDKVHVLHTQKIQQNLEKHLSEVLLRVLHCTSLGVRLYRAKILNSATLTLISFWWPLIYLKIEGIDKHLKLEIQSFKISPPV